jgi:hypothetical protein
MTLSLVSRILAILLAAMPATRGFADQTNLFREVQVGETGIPTTRALSHLAAGPTTADTVAVDSPLAHAADTEAQPPRPVAVPGGTDHSLSAGTFGSIVARTSATMRLPPLDELRVPSAAGRQRVSVAQAGPPVPDQKAPVDCAALVEDLFIDLKEVVKAGCMPSEKQIAKLLDNPVGNFVALPVQVDAVQVKVPQTGDTEWLYKFQFTPTFPISLGPSDWNLINRVVFPIYSAPLNKGVGDLVGLTPDAILSSPSFSGVLADPYDRTTGFGDMVYVGLLAPKQSIKIAATGGMLIWGAGSTMMFPTASETVLGTGKFGLGPAAVVGYLGPEWTVGLFPQHWWSVGGNPGRADVNLTNLQYFIYYAPPWDPKAQWRIGMSPNISIDWTARGDKLTVPVGLGIGRLFSLGPLPVQVTIEAEYAVIHPDDRAGSRWDIRLYFTPVIPTFLF